MEEVGQAVGGDADDHHAIANPRRVDLAAQERAESELVEATCRVAEVDHELVARVVLVDDTGVRDPQSVKRIILASGKVANEAIAHRDSHEVGTVAVVRVEQLYPWPTRALANAVARYPNSTEVVWLQEEPENMGAWNSIKAHLFDGHGMTHKVRRVSRTESGSPATGSNAIHQQEQEELLNRAFGAIG